MLLCLSMARMMFSFSICGSSGNGVLGAAAVCGQDREGPLRVEGEVGLRARFRCCRRPFPAGPLPHPACPSQGTGRSACLSRRSAAAGGGCWFRGPGGRDVASAIAVSRHGDAGGAGDHDLPLGEPPAWAAEAAFHLWHPEPVPALVLAARPAHQPAPCMVVDRAEHGLGHSVPEIVRPSPVLSGCKTGIACVPAERAGRSGVSSSPTMVKGVAHVAGPRRQGSEQRRQRAPHLAEVLQKLSVKRFTATSCNGLRTPGEGLRLGEALGLQHRDWHTGRGDTPFIEVVPRDHPHGVRVKGGRYRRLFVSDALDRLYGEHLWQLCDAGADLAVADLDAALVFTNLAGGTRFAPWRPEAVYDLVGRLRRDLSAEVPAAWTPHWMRHTHATALLLSGVPPHVVSRRLGHADVQTTLEMYANSRELHQLGEKSQVSRSQWGRNSVLRLRMAAV